MNDWLTALREGATQLNLTLTAEQEERFTHFLSLLLERNQHVNLTAIIDPVEVAIKHFVDSLTVETFWNPQTGDIAIDIGTGAGFPGMPLAIRHPEVNFVLNDSVRKKVDFLTDATAAMGLSNVTPVWARAETLGRDRQYRGRCNFAFARAVSHLGALVEYALPLLKVGGILIAMKGPTGEREVAESARVLNMVGGSLRDFRRLTLPGAGERQLIAIGKNHQTADLYPREPGMAKKKPLYLDSSKGTS